MQTVLRLLICLVISGSIALGAVPMRISLPQVEKAGCCAKMKAEPKSQACDRHAPKSEDDKQCCAACALGCAVLANAGIPFVYPANGDEKFAAFISSERLRSDRPPVPPPRA
jgi:anaerobic selenocysteine-containing dehydrogenase